MREPSLHITRCYTRARTRGPSNALTFRGDDAWLSLSLRAFPDARPSNSCGANLEVGYSEAREAD